MKRHEEENLKKHKEKELKSKRIVFYAYLIIISILSLVVSSLIIKEFLIPFLEIKSEPVISMIWFLGVVFSFSIGILISSKKQPTNVELAEAMGLITKGLEFYKMFRETFSEVQNRTSLEKEKDKDENNESKK